MKYICNGEVVFERRSNKNFLNNGDFLVVKSTKYIVTSAVYIAEYIAFSQTTELICTEVLLKEVTQQTNN